MGQSNSTQTFPPEISATPSPLHEAEDTTTQTYLLFFNNKLYGTVDSEETAKQQIAKWKRNLMMKYVCKLPDYNLSWREEEIEHETFTTFKTSLLATYKLYFLTYELVEAEIGYVAINAFQEQEETYEDEEEEYEEEEYEEDEIEYEEEEETQKEEALDEEWKKNN